MAGFGVQNLITGFMCPDDWFGYSCGPRSMPGGGGSAGNNALKRFCDLHDHKWVVLCFLESGTWNIR